MGGQKLQDTERTNEVGYGWMNLWSLLLGLTAWGIPAVYFSRRKPGGDRAGLACLLSMAACAGALGVQLAGDAWYFGKKVSKPTIGDGLRPVERADVARACRLMYVTELLTLAAVLGWGTLLAA